MSLYRLVRISHDLGGDDGTRTHDPLLAKQVLSQLSYTPEQSLGDQLPKVAEHRSAIPGVGFDLFSRTVASEVFSALQSLTSVFGMGTGGPSALKKPTAPQGHRSLKIEQQNLSFRIRQTALCRDCTGRSP